MAPTSARRSREPLAGAAETGRTEVVVFLLALAVRLAFCGAVYPFLADRFGPGDGYDEIARNLVQGNGYILQGATAASERLPLYPLLLAAIFALFGDRNGPWQAVQAALGAATCVGVLRIGRMAGDRSAAALAALFCAFHPGLVLYTARPMSETLYVLLVVLFARALFSRRPVAVAAGLWLGAGLLVKSTAVLQALAVAALVRPIGGAQHRETGHSSRKRETPRLLAGRSCALLVASAVLVVAPWATWNLASTGHANVFTATSGRALYHGLYISRHVGWATPAGDLNRDAEIALWGELATRGLPPDAPPPLRDAVAGELARQWIPVTPVRHPSCSRATACSRGTWGAAA